MRLDCKKAITLALAFLFPICAVATPEDVHAAGRRIAEAYAIGDAAALASLWSTGSAAAARRTQIELEQASRIACHELKGIAIDAVMGDDSTANLRMSIVRNSDTKHLRLAVHREGDRWMLTSCTLAEQEAAAQLAADPTKWDALVRDEPELLGRDLALALADKVTNGLAVTHGAEARAATAALENLAGLLGDPATRGLAATAEATLAEVQNDAAHARSYLAEALPLARKSNDADVLIRALIIQSRAFERGVNGNAPALDVMKEALPLLDRVNTRMLAAYVLGNVGNLNTKVGNYGDALTFFERAAAMSREIDDAAGVMRVETAEGLLLQIEGNNELAIVHMLRADALGANDPNDDAWRGQNFISLTQSYLALGRDKEAMEALRKAEELGRRSRAPIVIGETHRLLGSIYRRAHDYAAASRELEQALSVFESAKRIHFIPGAMSELALTRLEAGDARDAVTRAEKCAEFSRSLDQPLVVIECRTFGGEAHRALGENDAALAAFREAIDVSEERRRALIGDARQRAHFLERVISPYLGAADILADRGDVAAALELAEQAKSRTLLDILGGDVSHKQSVLTPSEEQRDAELAARMASLNRRARDAKEKAAIDSLSGEIAAARADYESYQLVLDAAHPRRMAMQGAVPIAKPADVAPLLGSSTAIIEYVVSGDHARAFVVTDHDVKSFRLDAGSRELDPIVARFADALAHEDIEYRKDAQKLYALLVRPLEPALKGRKAICIVPDGSLWRLPFEALIDRNGRFLIETRACSYAPSLSVLALVSRAPARVSPSTTLLAVGNPTMKEAQEEVRALRSLYGDSRSRVYAGADATKARVTGDMANARVIHFATHATFDEGNPMYSAVALAASGDAHDDGQLAAWEILRLDLHADIAILSACDTARGRLSPGEGVIGFTWALFVAGCPSSVVSEWKVDSASTKRLMVAFHRALLGSHDAALAKAEALRMAKLTLLRDANTRHPFYWSPFVLVGSAGTR